MTSRRTRIKGIANIPQRKKATAPLEPPLSSEKPPEKDHPNIIAQTDQALESSENLISTTDDVKDIKLEAKDLVEKPLPNTESEPQVSPMIGTCKDPPSIIKIESNESFTDSQTSKADEAIKTCLIEDETTKTCLIEDVKKTPLPSSKPISAFMRRKFLKPSINPNLLKPKPSVDLTNDLPKLSNESSSNEPAILQNQSQNVVILSQVTIPNSLKVTRDISKLISTEPLEPTWIPEHEPSSTVTIPKLEGSDTEYPGPPSSPNKFNRSRIKAVPRFGLRKPSASESEDESRRYYGRMRNNSVCSAASTANVEPQTPVSAEESLLKEVNVGQKKVFRNEQSRKLAEARREFYRKHVASCPDKQKLKMIDLIYYNPTGNPMSNNDSSATTTDNNPDDPPQLEQQPPEPETPNDADSDSSTLPVPQIKIGPSGEIVLDEQSLVVENTQIIKQKEQLLNSKVIDGDKATYGVYKRTPRGLSWSQKETLRFYKALNLIGTDFSLMSQLFPKRNRQELKNKFKKEDRVNRQLVDKVLREPCSYNFQDLKKEFQVDMEEEAFLDKLKEKEKQEMQKQKSEKRQQQKRSKSDSLGEETGAKRLRKLPLSIENVMDDCSADESDFAQIDSDCDFEEEEFIPFLKPTRSGRIPKSTQKFNETLLPMPEVVRRPPAKPVVRKIGASRIRRQSSVSSVDSNSERMVPGSVVVTAEHGPEGENDYKVFMVTPERKLTPLKLDSEVVDLLIKQGPTVKLPLEQNNATEIASECVEQNVTIVEGADVCFMEDSS